MKIMHLMLACFYIDNYSYQENLLPKYHKAAGNDVEIVASLFTFDENGNSKWIDAGSKYINEYGIPVTRLDFAKSPASRSLRRYIGLYGELSRFKPDTVFVHGVQFSDISVLVKYIKENPGVRVFADSHSDFSNSAKNWVSKNIQHKMLWRHYAQMIEPYVTKFYGVLPARVDFLVKMYKLPPEKVELLIMGADDDAVTAAAKPEVNLEFRKKFGIAEDDFLVMYGGKTDSYKKQVLLLMDAVNATDNPKLKLIVFGSVTPELKEEVAKRCSDRVQYVGWVLAADSYGYFSAADLIVFPGRHSVFWEQVAGQGIPMLVKYWDGTTHVDRGGNVRFLYKDSAEEIKQTIEDILEGDNYKKMKEAAVAAGPYFMYGEIAKRSIQ